ncbi:MAG: hypothetical protein LBI18_15445 [Planctomycetaceae bacterium]|nr:hypothetical protein [Planctomycetaceae bacterium]
MTAKFSFLFTLLFAFSLIVSIFVSDCFSQEREIFVPETELGALFEGATNRVLIKRNEFETLRQQAREIQLETEQDKNKPPAEAVLLSSDYRVEISDFRAFIDGILEIDVLADGLVSIPLPMEQVAVLEIVFDDSRQPVTLSENNGQKIMVLSGKQRYRIRLRLTTPLAIDATRQRLNFRLIYGTETSFRLSVPGDVELKSGASVLLRKVENGTTNFDLLLPPNNNRTEIIMSLNSHRKGEYSAILVRSVQFAEVTEHYERLHATVSLNELHQGVREASFYVPAGFEITDVQSVFLDRWNVRKSEENVQKLDKRDVLTIHFREQIPGLTTIYLSAIKSAKTVTQWSFPSFEPLNTVLHSAVLGLLLDEDLAMSHVASNNLFPIDTILLKNAIPPGALELLPGSPTLHLVSAWYAPSKDELRKNVAIKFRRAETDSVIETKQNLILSEKEPILQYTAKITPRAGKIFETTLEIPKQWKVLNVLDAAGQRLDFRLISPESATINQENGSDKTQEKMLDKIIVRFSKGVVAGESIQFSLHASGNIRDWFQNRPEKSLQYPVIRIDGLANEQGIISVQNKFEDDWEIIPSQTEHLTALTENLSFQYLSMPFTLSLRLEKLQPRLKAGTISFYRFDPSLLCVRYEIDYLIEQASVRQLTLLLPASTPPTPFIQGLNGLSIKETLSEETEINEQKFRRWKILFSEPKSGKIRIGVNFEQPIVEQNFSDTEIPFDLPPVIVENVVRQSGLIAVEGDEELDLTIPTERNGKLVLRSVDTGEISVANYQPGKRLLGVYSVTEPQNSVTINVRKNQTTELLSALIRHVSVTARIDRSRATESNVRLDFDSNTGAIYSVLYEIQTAGGTTTLRTSLNKLDELWSITLDDEPINAQRVGDDLLIPISVRNNNDFKQLVLLYHRQILPVYVSKKSLLLDFPTLSLNGKNGNEKIPVMQTTWDIIPPFGYKIIRLGDNVLHEAQPALFEIFHGVIDFFNILTYRPAQFTRFASVNIPPSPYFQNNRTDHDHSGLNHSGLGRAFSREAKNNATLQFDNDVREGQASGSGTSLGESIYTLNLHSSEATDEQKETSTSSMTRGGGIISDSSDPEPAATLNLPELLNLLEALPQESLTPSVRHLQSIQPVSVIVSENESTDFVGGYSVIGSRDVQNISVQLSRIAVGQRWGWLAFLVVVLFGLFGLAQSRQRRTLFVFGLLILGTILIFVPGLELFATIFNGIVYGAVLVGAIYIVHTLWSKIVSVTTKPDISESKTPVVNIASILFLIHLCLPVCAAEQNELLPKIQFPDDAIIVPYSPDQILDNSLPDPDKLTLPEQSLLVPYRQYIATLELLKKQNEKIQNNQHRQNVPNFAVPFTISAAEYQTELPTDGDDILLRGKIGIDVFTDQAVLVPLTLENGVFVQPLLDGKPAVFQSQHVHQTVLLVEGNGRHELSFGIRIRIQRQGGWRIAAGKLPLAATSKISLTLPNEIGDLLTTNPLDKSKWSFGTNSDNISTENTNKDVAKNRKKIIETSPKPNGLFHWQWRSAVSGEHVDRNLEVDSAIRYDIQEDGIWVRWTPTFHISRGKWEMIRLCLPTDYLIAEITGENVRGWNIVQVDSKIRTIDVELLKPAEKTETLFVLLSAPQWFVKPSMSLMLPKLTIPDAGIHRGRIDLFDSSAMNLKVQESSGLLPTDQVVPTKQQSILKVDTISPLGSSPFRSFRFSSENYSLRLKWNRTIPQPSIDCFSVLKITRQNVALETKILINGQNRPFYTSIQLPEKFVLKNVSVPDGILWNRESGQDGIDKENCLNIICADSRSLQVEVLIDGDFSGAFSKNRNEIETLPIFKTENENISLTTAILTEPSLDVRTSNADIRKDTPDSVFSWLSLPEQRELVRFALSYRTSVCKLILSERKPEIRCSTITNVRTTVDAIEETTLLDFDITKAGVKNIEFVLPSWMSNAKIDAPFLRRKTVTPLDTKNADSPVLVRLELHEEIMEQLRVLIQTDRRLQTETDYQIFVPIIRTCQTIRQYIVMENDRRSPDEMIVDRLQNLRALNRQQNEWSYLVSILGGNVTEAYFATKKDDSGNNVSNDVSNDAANLLFRMKRRETVQLADARIDLAETRLTLGNNGDYLAEQIYRIDNKKEPYLDILLPEGASLWGARILTSAEWQQKEHNKNKDNIGLPVKPNIMPTEIASRYRQSATKSQLIRIPLVKTESGDVDFIVRLVYAGELQKFSGWSRQEIPFIDVLNIPVGESLVRLNLPDRYEYQFQGNLRRVRQEQESETIRQVQSNYQRQQTDRLRQVVKDFNPFAAKRAKINLKQLDFPATVSDSSKNQYWSGSLTGQGQIVTNNNAITSHDATTLTDGKISKIEEDSLDLDNNNESAEFQSVVSADETEVSFGSNSATLNSNFYNQTNTFSGQLVQQKTLTINKTANQPTTTPSSSFNDNWFSSNSLANPNMRTSGVGGTIDANQTNVQNNVAIQGGKILISSQVSPSSQVIPQGIPQGIVPQQQVIPQQHQNSAIIPSNTTQSQNPTNSLPIGSPITENNATIGQSTNQPFFSIDTKTFPLEPAPPIIPNSNAINLGFSVGFSDTVSNYSGQTVTNSTSSKTPLSSTMPESNEKHNRLSERQTGFGGRGGKLGRTEPSAETSMSVNSGMLVSDGTYQVFETESTIRRNKQEIVNSENLRNLETETVEQIVPIPILSTQTSSLDIEIPYTGKTFLFTGTQGSLNLSFRPIAERTGSRSIQILFSLLGLAFLYGIYRFCFSIGNRLTFDRRTHRNIAGLVTILSILSLMLAPLVSVLLFIFAVLLWITLFPKKSAI